MRGVVRVALLPDRVEAMSIEICIDKEELREASPELAVSKIVLTRVEIAGESAGELCIN